MSVSKEGTVDAATILATAVAERRDKHGRVWCTVCNDAVYESGIPIIPCPCEPGDSWVKDAIVFFAEQKALSRHNAPGQPLDVREVSGCAECPLGTSTNDCIEGIDFPLWQCGHDGEPRQGQAPTVAPDWCPLRKGPVTLRLKEGA